MKLISKTKGFHLTDKLSLAELQRAVDEDECPDTIKVTGLEYWNKIEKKWK